MPGMPKDYAGMQFGALKAVRISDRPSDGNGTYWEFECICGATHTARINTVKYVAQQKNDPQLPSCGCIELQRKTKHGYRKSHETHRAYQIYRGIMTRCYNQSDRSYKHYGAKGVTICDAWKDDPKAFVNWAISAGCAKGLHLDKDIKSKKLGINPPIYSPETCQWISAQKNIAFATNRDNYGKHPNIKLTHEQVTEIQRLYFSGECTNKSQLARKFGVYSPSSIGRLLK